MGTAGGLNDAHRGEGRRTNVCTDLEGRPLGRPPLAVRP